MPSSVNFRFDDFELDLAVFEPRRHGDAIEFEPRVFSLLQYLLENYNRVIPKEELLQEVWPGVVVTQA